MSISDRLDQMQARADAATEGPWGHIQRDLGISIGSNCDERGNHALIHYVGSAQEQVNAEFIAAARADMPALIAAVRAVLDVCAASLIEARPTDGREPYMIVRADAIQSAIAAALGEEQS